ncbi:MAG: hypothetical protein CVU57_20940 [Deltaproteobacteria bacterium HGW-Deltaproteobacteria-15]|jgi:hypothetical protein|nr:MAG: hypothetical protein CVU57_20940 [Deltaproteobacteria bacterium HGW-Deltaproteobacteria-15]PKN99385.1 MAG: hypothetical protein CVU43_15305 [Chloroflexi bacterium HGW-Chloroflexi-5]
MIFEADPNQITGLDSLQLVQLMKRLLLTECRLVGIPLRSATVPLQITVADEGEDGRVEWTSGAGSTDYFPERFCIFQSKAQNLTRQKVAAEILKKTRKGPAKLNAAVAEVLSRNGAYVLFCSHAFTGQKVKQLREAIESAIRAGGEDPSNAGAIEIYDANRIADWVNTHPSVALWLAELHRRRTLVGFLSHEAWGRSPDIAEVPWVADETPRFAPVNEVIPEAERKDRNRNAWTFEQASEAALEFLAKDKGTLRIAGPSGFGKSRFAFELFNGRRNLSDEIEKTSVIYADVAIVGDEALKLALEIADSGFPAILVVDECSDENNTKLAEIARRVGSRLRLVTIDIETKVLEAAHTLVLHLEPAGDEMIGAIAQSVTPTLGESVTRLIQELAKGFPKMAVLAAQQKGIRRKAIRSAQEMLDRVIWGRRQRNENAQKALELLSLFEWVGFKGRVADEVGVIAQNLAGMTKDEFVEGIKSFRSRGIITERGDFVQVSPIPLAAALGANRLSVLPNGRLAAFFTLAPERLKKSLLQRMRWLDTHDEAKDFARRILDPAYMGNLQILNTDPGAECLDRLVHVDPDLAMATIQRAFGELDDEGLKAIDAGRRNLVWALEKLAFRKETFEGAATLLRRLAACETETRISNNATGQFKQLYQLYLSGTEAEPGLRLLVLDDGLRSLYPKERQVCLEALDQMLDTDHFSRSGGAEEIGSGEHLQDWVPKTYGEMRDFLRAGVKRLISIADSKDPLALRAKEILGSHIRGLISALPLEEVKAMVSCIVNRYGFWIEAVKGVNHWLYYDRRGAPRKVGRDVHVYFEELLPSDPVELVALYTHGWSADFHDPDVDYDREERSHIDFEYASRKALELAEVIASNPSATNRVLERLVTSDAKNVFPLARRLAELSPNVKKLFKTALSKAEQREEPPNQQFFDGLISGADNRDPSAARECIRLGLRSEKLKKAVISMIGSVKLQPKDIHLVISLLRSKKIPPAQCAYLSYGQRMAHLDIKDIILLLEELASCGAEGPWTVLDIVSLILHGAKKKPPKPLILFLRNVLASPGLFTIPPHRNMDGYRMESIVEILAHNNQIGRPLARALVKQLLSICTPNMGGVFNVLKHPVRGALKALIDRHPREVWVEVARILQGKDLPVRHRLEQLIQPDHKDHLGRGLLHSLPESFYLEWVRKDAPNRASIVVEWLPVAKKEEDGTLTWHPALQDFIAEFGNQDRVLRTVASRLHPRSWSGSLVPHLERQLKLVKSWSAHAHPQVRKWARCQVAAIGAQIEAEKKRDEENEVRYS